MGKDVKIGLALGLVVIVVAIVIFSVSSGERPLPDEGAARVPPAGEPAGPGTVPPDRRPVDIPLDPGVLLRREDARDTSPSSPGHGVADRVLPRDTQDTASILVRGVPAPATRNLEHVVKSGDTLWGLAKKYYGNALYLSKIQQANRDKLPTPGAALQIGMKLVIPDVPASDEARVPREAVGEPAAAEGEYDVYSVRPGDTLAIIALRFYGDDRMVKPIVKANPRLAANPDRILVGWQLRIPKPPAGERTARRDID